MGNFAERLFQRPECEMNKGSKRKNENIKPCSFRMLSIFFVPNRTVKIYNKTVRVEQHTAEYKSEEFYLDFLFFSFLSFFRFFFLFWRKTFLFKRRETQKNTQSTQNTRTRQQSTIHLCRWMSWIQCERGCFEIESNRGICRFFFVLFSFFLSILLHNYTINSTKFIFESHSEFLYTRDRERNREDKKKKKSTQNGISPHI